MDAVQAFNVTPAAIIVSRRAVLLFLVAGLAVGLACQPPAVTNGATILWFASFVAIALLITVPRRERNVMLDIATHATGSAVKVNRIVGPETRVRDAIFLGTTGKGATVQLLAPFDAVVTIRHDDPTAWLEDPRSGRTYGAIAEDPVLATSAAELE